MHKQELLDRIAGAVNTCQKCRLHKTRGKAVPGEGKEDAQVMFVGQCPGFNEDREGRPFVGKAGKLLDELLGLVSLSREEVFITNIVKCRPPENRDPMVDEVRSCKPYLAEQIKTVNPRVIVALGRFAMEHFIKEGSITENHGRPVMVAGRVVLPLFHPAAALRSARVARDLRVDFKKIPKILSGEIKVAEAKNNSDDSQMNLL